MTEDPNFAAMKEIQRKPKITLPRTHLPKFVSGTLTFAFFPLSYADFLLMAQSKTHIA
jgi:hypothetical protein